MLFQNHYLGIIVIRPHGVIAVHIKLIKNHDNKKWEWNTKRGKQKHQRVVELKAIKIDVWSSEIHMQLSCYIQTRTKATFLDIFCFSTLASFLDSFV